LTTRVRPYSIPISLDGAVGRAETGHVRCAYGSSGSSSVQSWGLTAWAREARDGGARAEGVDVAYLIQVAYNV